MTDRTDPGETAEIWRGLKVMWEDGLLRPTVFDRSYRGLESVVSAMKDLQARYVWGKAVCCWTMAAMGRDCEFES
jgi:NADPH2:quinone reductase